MRRATNGGGAPMVGLGALRRAVGSVIETIVAAGSSAGDHPNVLIRPEHRRCPPGGRSGRTAGSTNRAAEGPPDDIHHLVDVGVRLASLGGGPNASANMILEVHGAHRA